MVGERLREALSQRGLSQAAAAELAKMPQPRINDIINKRRMITADQLRQIATIGVSADYLLGVVDVDHPIGATRSQAEMAEDLRQFVARHIALQFPRDVVAAPLTAEWQVSSVGLLDFVLERIGELARRQVTEAERLARIRLNLDGLERVQHTLIRDMNAIKRADPQLMLSDAFLSMNDQLQDLHQVSMSLGDDLKPSEPDGPVHLKVDLRSSPKGRKPRAEAVEVPAEPGAAKKPTSARKSARFK